MGITDTCHRLLNDVAKDNSHHIISVYTLLCYDQLCYDKILLMNRRVLLFFVNNLFPDLTPRVNISLAG